jgi:hypothetical protein
MYDDRPLSCFCTDTSISVAGLITTLVYRAKRHYFNSPPPPSPSSSTGCTERMKYPSPLFNAMHRTWCDINKNMSILHIKAILQQLQTDTDFLWIVIVCMLLNIIVYIHVRVIRYRNHIDGVMVSVLASSTVDRVFEPRLDQPKDYKIVLSCFNY